MAGELPTRPVMPIGMLLASASLPGLLGRPSSGAFGASGTGAGGNRSSAAAIAAACGGGSGAAAAQELVTVHHQYYEGNDCLMMEDILHHSNPQLFPLKKGSGKPFVVGHLVAC